MLIKAYISLNFEEFKKRLRELRMVYNTIFFAVCRHTYWMDHQCYGSEKFSQHHNAIKSGPF